jgi:phosphoheptose isomerase
MPEQPARWAEDLARAALALARAFAGGSTMWCVAPRSPEHARHIAVEFVHPVIMGKRALPAVAVDSPDLTASVRAVARSGDTIVAVGESHDPAIVALLRRAPAWGVETLWIGRGERPASNAADHILWVDDADGSTGRDSALILRYHLLWELTHVCFEHPGLLHPAAACDDDGVCITCSDEGRLGEVVDVTSAIDATVRTARGVEAVDVTMVAPVEPGSLVLVHAGAAISLVDDSE